MAFKKALIERALGAELGFHLGYPSGADKPETTKGQRCSNDTHESKTDADARLYRKGNCVIALVPIAHQRAATASS